MEYGEKFKKSMFGGFDRQDVLRCLEEMQKQSNAELQRLTASLDALTRQQEDLQARFDAQSEELRLKAAALAAAETELAAKEKALQHSEACRDELQREMSAQKALGSELLMKKNVLEENCRTLTDEIENLKAKNQALAQQIDDRASLAIGELMVEAKVNANHILTRAQERADQSDAVIRAQCEGADMRLSELQARLAKVIENFQKVAAAAVQNIEQITGEIDQCRALIRDQIPEDAAETPAQES